MRLYKSNSGQWFGTQADARRNSPRQWVEVDVPTSKQDLLNWLNDNKVGGISQQTITEPTHEPKGDYGQLNKKSKSWVSWALGKLIMGEKDEAIEMLKLGLNAQKGGA
jgi:hypothetical protein